MLTTKNSGALWLAIAASGVVLLGGCMQPGPRALLDGDRLIREQKYAEAVQKLKTAVELLPQNAQAWNRLGLAYHGASQPTEALRAYRQALQHDPNLAVVRYNLGCLLLEQNHLGAAITELTSYTVLARNAAEGWLKLGSAQLRAQQFDAADKSYRAALQLNSALAEAWNGLGLIQAHRNRPNEARQHFTAALQRQPGYAPALLNLAILHHQQLNNRAQAAQFYREYLKVTPPPKMASAVLDVLQQLDWELNPRSILSAATNVAAPSAESSRTLSTNTVSGVASSVGKLAVPRSTLVETNGISKALAAVPANSGNPDPSHRGALGNESAARPPAIERADIDRTELPAKSRPPQTGEEPDAKPAVNQPEQTVLEQKKDELREEPATARTSSSPPSDEMTRPSQSKSAGETNAAHAAPREPLFAPRKPAERPGILERMNPASWFRGREAGQRAEQEQDEERKGQEEQKQVAVARSPDKSGSAGTHSNSAAARPVSPPEIARPSFARYKYAAPTSPPAGDRQQAEAHFARGFKAHRERRLGDAIAAYQQAIRVDPTLFEAHHNLGLAALELKNLPLALSAYERALSINATSADARYHFALALQQANYPIDAAAELQRILDAQPTDVRAHFALAKLYADVLSRPDLARPHYQKVIELDPRHAQATAIRYWLAAHP